MGEDLVLGVAGFDAQGEGDFEELAVQGFLADLEAVARELHGEGGGALGEVAVLEVSDRGAGQAADVHAVVFEEARVLAGAEGVDEEVRDVGAGDELAAAASGCGDFHPLAVVKSGAGGEFGDFVQIEAHGEQEVEEGDA